MTAVSLMACQLGFVLIAAGLWLAFSLGTSVFLSFSVLHNDQSKWAGFMRKLFIVSVLFAMLSQLLLMVQFALSASYAAYFAGDILSVPCSISAVLGFGLSGVGIMLYAQQRQTMSRFRQCLGLLAVVLGTSLSLVCLAWLMSWMQQPSAAMFSVVGYRMELTSLAALLTQPLFFAKCLHVLGSALLVGASALLALHAFYLRRFPSSEQANRGFNRSARIAVVGVIVLLLGSMQVQSVPFTVAQQTGKDQVVSYRESIERGLQAHKAMLRLRDDLNDTEAQTQFEQHRNELGYAWLLAPLRKSIVDAEPKHIALAAQAAADHSPLIVVWAYRIMVFLGVFSALWVLTALAQPWLGPWSRRRLTWFIHGAPLSAVAFIVGWCAAISSLAPWMFYGVLPLNLAVSSSTVLELSFAGLLGFVAEIGAAWLVFAQIKQQLDQDEVSRELGY